MRPILIALAILVLSAVDGFAIVQPVEPIPTLSEWGLIALIVLMGLVGALVLRKRMASARSSR